jgi:hypothetical protein
MYLAEFDSSKRLLRITVTGDTTTEEISSALEDLRSLLKDVQPGFRLLADLRALVSMPTDAATYLGGIMEASAEKGVAMVVRLLPPDPSKDIGLAIISQFHYPRDVPIITCATLEEAMEILNEKNSNRRALRKRSRGRGTGSAGSERSNQKAR